LSSEALANLGNKVSSDAVLLGIGLFLTLIVAIAWVYSNRAEATPNPDQLAEMHQYVNTHFARYVARGLAAEGTNTVAISQDRAWRKVYLQHLHLHNELYSYRTDVAIRVFESDIDAAVTRELAAMRAAGATPSAAVAVS
jgi:ribulose kinase